MVAVAERIELEDVPAEVQVELLLDEHLHKRSLQFVLFRTGSLLRGLLNRDPTVAEVQDTLSPIHERLSAECVAGLSGNIQAALQKALHGGEVEQPTVANTDGVSTAAQTVESRDSNNCISQMMTPEFCTRLKKLSRHAMLIRFIVLEYQQRFDEDPQKEDVYAAIEHLKNNGSSVGCENFDNDIRGRDQKIMNMIEHGTTNLQAQLMNQKTAARRHSVTVRTEGA